MTQLSNLNQEQQEAVNYTEGPLLIIAGAGAGKTKTITHRILHLIQKGVEPSKILAVTFTNKAAKEMRERVLKLLSEDKSLNFPGSDFSSPYTLHPTPSPLVCTFHSLGVKILRENSKLLGINTHFTILDRGDSIKFIKDAMDEVGIDRKNFEPSMIQGLISREKGDGVTVEKFLEKIGDEHIPKIVGSVWKK